MNIFRFSKSEIVFLILVFSVLSILMYSGFQTSLTKSRDVERKSDVRSIYNMLSDFQRKFSFYPTNSVDGKIVACNPVQGTESIIFSPCDWGEHISYLDYTLPRDPSSKDGREYNYLSSGTRFQVYASLESKGEAEYNPSVEKRQLKCGVNAICNFGLSSSLDTPLDKSLEEYEIEINYKTHLRK